jgi:hypothetical protein
MRQGHCCAGVALYSLDATEPNAFVVVHVLLYPLWDPDAATGGAGTEAPDTPDEKAAAPSAGTLPADTAAAAAVAAEALPTVHTGPTFAPSSSSAVLPAGARNLEATHYIALLSLLKRAV